SLLQRRSGDLRRGQANPLVYDVHARVARADRDLLGAVGVTVEARLADQDLGASPEPLLQLCDLGSQIAEVLLRDRRRLAPHGPAAVPPRAAGAPRPPPPRGRGGPAAPPPPPPGPRPPPAARAPRRRPPDRAPPASAARRRPARLQARGRRPGCPPRRPR